MSHADAIGGIRAAARAWEMYNPRLRFVYLGTTNDRPLPRDGKLVVGWVPLGKSDGVVVRGDPMNSFDMDVLLAIERPWRWVPCHTRCAPVRQRWCSIWCVPGADDYMQDNGGGQAYTELQGLVTHELGHVVGLDEADPAWRGVTMSVFDYEEPPRGLTSRSLSTLGLGDVLGMKALYPWKCPKKQRGRPYPPAYKHLCPKIKIYVP